MKLFESSITFKGKGKKALTDTEGYFKDSGLVSLLKGGERISNIEKILADLIEKGITDPKMQAAILAVISKESGFTLGAEMDYTNTSPGRIRKIFSKFSKSSDEEINRIKKSPTEFFNKIYGGKYGNSPTEGFKYRGRGFNGLTFKSAYDSISKKIGMDLVNDPDKLNDPDVASKALAAYYEDAFKTGAKLGKIQAICGSPDPNNCKTLEQAAKIAYLATAGWNASLSAIGGEGFKRVMDRIYGFYKMVISMGVPDPAPDNSMDKAYSTVGSGPVPPDPVYTAMGSGPAPPTTDGKSSQERQNFLKKFSEFVKNQEKRKEILSTYKPED
jgi:predicted chitinase